MDWLIAVAFWFLISLFVGLGVGLLIRPVAERP